MPRCLQKVAEDSGNKDALVRGNAEILRAVLTNCRAAVHGLKHSANISTKDVLMHLTFLGKESLPDQSPTLYATDRARSSCKAGS